MMEEVWKDIPGFEGVYVISNMGNVRSNNMRRHTSEWNREKKTNIIEGYDTVRLFRPDGTFTQPCVHKLVAQLFVPNDDYTKANVRHINGNRRDNRAENLEWFKKVHKPMVTDAMREGMRRAQKLSMEVVKIPIYIYKMDGTFVGEFPSVPDARRALGIKKRYVRCGAPMPNHMSRIKGEYYYVQKKKYSKCRI